jgi:hypothetical protein
MKKLIALSLMVVPIAIGIGTGCSGEKKEETLDYAKLLKIKEAIERGSGNAIQRYGEMIGPEKLANIESNPEFIEIKNQALADLNGLIEEALNAGVDKEALVACIKENGADSPICARYVEDVRSKASPRLEQYDADLKKFLANHADKNKHLPKVAGNCKAVHSGIFQLFIEGDTMLISRDENIQIEQFRGDVRKEKITWVSDCTYRIELIKEEKDPDVHLVGPGGFLDDSFVEIIHVTEEYYMYKIFSSVDGKAGELIDIGKVYLTK